MSEPIRVENRPIATKPTAPKSTETIWVDGIQGAFQTLVKRLKSLGHKDKSVLPTVEQPIGKKAALPRPTDSVTVDGFDGALETLARRGSDAYEKYFEGKNPVEIVESPGKSPKNELPES